MKKIIVSLLCITALANSAQLVAMASKVESAISSGKYTKSFDDLAAAADDKARTALIAKRGLPFTLADYKAWQTKTGGAAPAPAPTPTPTPVPGGKVPPAPAPSGGRVSPAPAAGAERALTTAERNALDNTKAAIATVGGAAETAKVKKTVMKELQQAVAAAAA